MAYTRLEDKDPNSSGVDYKIDLSESLADDEIVGLVDSVVTDDVDLVIDSSTIVEAGKSIKIILSGGRLGALASVTARYTTSSVPARTDDATFVIRILSK